MSSVACPCSSYPYPTLITVCGLQSLGYEGFQNQTEAVPLFGLFNCSGQQQLHGNPQLSSAQKVITVIASFRLRQAQFW